MKWTVECARGTSKCEGVHCMCAYVHFTDVYCVLRGSPFIKYLDNFPPIPRDDNGPLRMPIVDKYKVMYYIYSYYIAS